MPDLVSWDGSLGNGVYGQKKAYTLFLLVMSQIKPNNQQTKEIIMTNTKKTALISCLAAIIGSFLPWATINAGFLGTTNLAGTVGDGQATIGFAAVTAAFCYFGKRTGLILGMIVCAMGAIMALNDIVNISDAGKQFEGTAVSLTPGYGVYLTLAGFAVAFVMMIFMRKDLRSENSETLLPQFSENKSMVTGL